MIISIIQILYLIILLMFIVSGLFVIYHIVRFSYSKLAMMFMLILFCCVTGILLITNISLFYSVNFSDILSSFM